jgi:hypothetical protein
LSVAVLLSICFPFQPIKCHPSVARRRMVMHLQDVWIWHDSHFCNHFIPSQHQSTTFHHNCIWQCHCMQHR